MYLFLRLPPSLLTAPCPSRAYFCPLKAQISSDSHLPHQIAMSGLERLTLGFLQLKSAQPGPAHELNHRQQDPT